MDDSLMAVNDLFWNRRKVDMSKDNIKTLLTVEFSADFPGADSRTCLEVTEDMKPFIALNTVNIWKKDVKLSIYEALQLATLRLLAVFAKDVPVFDNGYPAGANNDASEYIFNAKNRNRYNFEDVKNGATGIISVEEYVAIIDLINSDIGSKHVAACVSDYLDIRTTVNNHFTKMNGEILNCNPIISGFLRTYRRGRTWNFIRILYGVFCNINKNIWGFAKDDSDVEIVEEETFEEVEEVVNIEPIVDVVDESDNDDDSDLDWHLDGESDLEFCLTGQVTIESIEVQNNDTVVDIVANESFSQSSSLSKFLNPEPEAMHEIVEVPVKVKDEKLNRYNVEMALAMLNLLDKQCLEMRRLHGDEFADNYYRMRSSHLYEMMGVSEEEVAEHGRN
eukprot:TRINITY_DN1291_c0_g1_i4.p1 TRINITY_DN1291_c0_g1~~TRINITY_DN1291_c0_g1_i4.p1  ORF type:complete len:424 (-),score=36.94 TRINITY_DN1291_c0_g1_i4:286-1461(-)